MSIAILGANGQLGGELRQRLGPRAVAWTRQEVDLTEPGALEAVLGKHRLEAVINCAAYNAVDRAEVEPETAFQVNALGPRRLAEFCEGRGVPLVHVSSDYVFGLDTFRATPYRETDLPGPLGVYGVTKLAGEAFVRAGCSRHYILRTCGLYGRWGRTGKRHFVETMLQLSQGCLVGDATERPEESREKGESQRAGRGRSPRDRFPARLKVVCDQRCTPTSTADLAEVIENLLSTEAYGTYHATNAGDCTWAEFATEIFRLANVAAEVVPITSAEYGAKACRPSYSVLDCGKLTQVLGRPMRSWREALAEYLSGGEEIRRGGTM